MRFWSTTVLIMVLTCNLLIILLSVVLLKKEWVGSVGYKTAGLVAFLVWLRMLTPFELPITTNLYFPYHISMLISEFGYERFWIGSLRFSLWNITEVIWGVGIIWNIYRFWKNSRVFQKYIKKNGTIPKKQEKYEKCVQYICGELGQKKEFQLLELEELSVPAVWMRKKPCILLPTYIREYSEQELYYILRHEMLHFFNHDFLLKYLIQFIGIVYWWNPFGKILQRKCEILLEMRIDDILVGSDSIKKEEYLSCLIITAKRSCAEKLPETAIAFCQESERTLIQRVWMLTTEKKEKKLVHLGVMAFAFSIYFFSICFIIESDYIPPEILESEDFFVPTEENSYIVDHEDGTYTMYFDDWGDPWTMESIEHYDNVPIYTEEEIIENENMFEKEN